MFKTKSKLESHKKEPENKDFCCKEVCSSNQYLKFATVAVIIYADLESLIGKVIECKNNPQQK